jgi:predicted GIY-YIG superfamily endonuclease
VRPEDLARELGIDGERLRGWLRSRWPRSPEEHGLPWYLTPEQVAEVRRAFAGAQPRSSRQVVVQRAAPVARRPSADPPPPSASRLSWPDLQQHADAVLASGLKDLMAQPANALGPVSLHGPGVYAFADGAITAYVGESTSVSWRIGQHRDLESRFLIDLGASGIDDPAARIGIRSLAVDIGRLELEEFAIACLQPSLNRMRRMSRTALAYETSSPDLWRAVQADAGRLLRAGITAALDISPVPWKSMLPPPGAGLYVLRDSHGQPLYVGESDALGERLRTHAGSRSYFSALRRHVGTELLGLAFVPNVKRGFSPADEASISAHLATCSIAILPLAFGRWELERELVHELLPILNREHAV